MANPFYTWLNATVAPFTRARAQEVRQQFQAISEGFDKVQAAIGGVPAAELAAKEAQLEAEDAALRAENAAGRADATLDFWGGNSDQPASIAARDEPTGLWVDWSTSHPNDTFYRVNGQVLYDGPFMGYVAAFGPPPLPIFNVARNVVLADGSAGMSVAGQVPFTWQTGRKGALAQVSDNLTIRPAYFPFGEDLTVAVDATKLAIGQDGLVVIFNADETRLFGMADDTSGKLIMNWFRSGGDPDNDVSSQGGALVANSPYPVVISLDGGAARVSAHNEIPKLYAHDDVNSGFVPFNPLIPRLVKFAGGTSPVVIHGFRLLPRPQRREEMVSMVGPRPTIKAAVPLLEFKERSAAFGTGFARDGCHVVIDDGAVSRVMRAVGLPYEQHAIGGTGEPPRRPVAVDLHYQYRDSVLRASPPRTVLTPPGWALGKGDASHFAVSVHPYGPTKGQIDLAIGWLEASSVIGSSVETLPIQWGTKLLTVSDDLAGENYPVPPTIFQPPLAVGSAILPGPSAHIPWAPQGGPFSGRALIPLTQSSSSRAGYRDGATGAWQLGAFITGLPGGGSFDEWWAAWTPASLIIGTHRVGGEAAIAISTSADGGATLQYVKKLGVAQNFNGYASPMNLIQVDPGATVSALGEFILGHPLGTSALSHGLRLYRLSGSSPATLSITHIADVLRPGQALRGCRIDPIFGLGSNLFLVSIDYSLGGSLNERAGVVSMIVEPQWVAV